MITEMDFLLRVLLAIFCGLCIGLERQMTGHITGIKTNILICFGSCVFVLFSFLTGDDDVSRIAAQVVSGVGFLCSSVIIKNGISINGLNTSATIWCTAGIGILSSLGQWKISLIATFVLIFSNLIFYPLAEKIPVFRKFEDDTEERVYKLCVSCRPNDIVDTRKFVVDTINNTKFILTGIEIKEDEHNIKTTIRATVSFIGKMDNSLLEDVVSNMCKNNLVLGVNWKMS